MMPPNAARSLIRPQPVFRFLFLSTLLSVLDAGAGIAQLVWEPTGGPTGGSISALTEHNDNLYAGVLVGGMFTSADGGRNWTRLDVTDLFERVDDFATNSQGHLFAGSTSGVRRSTDNGETWVLFTEGLSRDVRSLAVNTSDVVFAATAGNGVFRSEDNGESWISASGGLPAVTGYAVTIGPEGNVYLGTDSGVFASEDNGDSWTNISEGQISTLTFGLFVDSAETLWAATLSGLYKKAHPDSSFDLAYNRSAWAIDTTSLGTLFAAGPVILRSTDGGTEWTEHPFESHGIFSNAVELARRGDLMFVGTSPTGVFVSEDDGQMWQQTNDGLDAAAVTSLAGDGNGVLFAGASQGVFRTTDQGSTWEHTSLEWNNIESLLVTSSGLVLAGTNNNGLHLSSDGGETWSPVDTTFSQGNVRSQAEALNGVLFAGGSGEVVIRSVDDWATWDTVDTGPTFNEIQALGVSPSGTILAGSRENVRRSTDGGDTWEDARAGLPESRPDLRGFEFLPNGDVLAAAFQGVFRSSDDGQTWEATGQTPGAGLTSIERAGSSLFITIRGIGVALSEDDAATWTLINDGLNSLDANSLWFESQAPAGKSYQSASDVLYVGVRGGGVSRMVGVPTSDTGELPDGDTGPTSRLSANHPNPFSAQTSFVIDLDHPIEVKAELLDILGRTVLEYSEHSLPAGKSVVRIDGANLPAGVYIYRVDFGDGVESRLVSVAK